MLKGGITMSVVKPNKELAYGAIDLAVAVVRNDKIKFSATVNNGRIDVPAELFPPMVIDKSNYEKVLVQNGFLTEDEIRPK
jgi:ABC-type xylose transport system substrate-binding protein